MEMVFFVLADQEVACGGSLLGGILKQALSCCLDPGNLFPCFISCSGDDSFDARLPEDLVMAAWSPACSLCRDGTRDHDI